MKHYLSILLLLLCSTIEAQMNYKYRLLLTDKGDCAEMLSNPEKLLSDRALERRQREGVAVDSTDVPVCAAYLDILREAGYPVVVTSRWMNSVVVSAADSVSAERLLSFPFIREATLVWKNNGVQESFFVERTEEEKDDEVHRREMRRQVFLHNGQELHRQGYRGEGMLVAVIDAGFLNLDQHPALLKQVVGMRDFVNPESDLFATHFHGTRVFSTMASSDTSVLWGTAPNASYWLLRSEDSSSEFPVEEDYWIAAAEFADSVGVDVINSSLGYYQFDDPAMNYKREDLNGKHAFITQGAGIGASKGMIIVNSAGNERAASWQAINFPADHPSLLTVGAVASDMSAAYFSGVGFVSPGYVKPDVAGLGDPAYVLMDNGVAGATSGTSFSGPVVCGLVTCLWQARPDLQSQQVLDLVRESSSAYLQPDSLTGYGIPDFRIALDRSNGTEPTSPETTIRLFPQQGGCWQFAGIPVDAGMCRIQVYAPSGTLLMNVRFQGERYTLNLRGLPRGIYMVRLDGDGVQYSKCIIQNK